MLNWIRRHSLAILGVAFIVVACFYLAPRIAKIAEREDAESRLIAITCFAEKQSVSDCLVVCERVAPYYPECRRAVMNQVR